MCIKHLREGWRIQQADLKLDTMVAAGAGGEVWRGRWALRDEGQVAIKKIFITPDTADAIFDEAQTAADADAIIFNNKEIEMMTRARHRRIVLFFGAGQLAQGTHGWCGVGA